MALAGAAETITKIQLQAAITARCISFDLLLITTNLERTTKIRKKFPNEPPKCGHSLNFWSFYGNWEFFKKRLSQAQSTQHRSRNPTPEPSGNAHSMVFHLRSDVPLNWFLQNLVKKKFSAFSRFPAISNWEA
jgi:hypothetical protein